jgi:flagellar export protein FliJ
MADTLATLVKLAKDKVEKAQQEVARVADAIEVCKAHLVDWEREIVTNGALAVVEGDPLLFHQAAAHTQRLRGLMERERAKISRLEEEKEEKMQVLRERFSEQKRYEILLAKQQLEKARVLARKRQSQLDEIGGQRVERQKKQEI